MIYLDYSANTPADPAVLEAFCKTELAYVGNPNSTHCAGRAAQTEMARATSSIAGMLGVNPNEIIYTSGASESNNLAIKGIAQACRHTGRHIISTALEHSSVGGSLSALQSRGCEIDLVDVGRDGIIDLEQLRDLLRKDTVLVSVCTVDSELGQYPAVRFNSPENAVAHILNLSVRGVKGTLFQQALSRHGVCVSVKSACSAEGTPSKAVFAVSRDRKNALSSWRISLSHLTTQEEITEFLRIFDLCYKELVP